MDLILDSVFCYRGFCGNAAECRIRVYEAPGRAAVVIASELASNRGTSIIHMVTHLAGWVWQILEQPPGGLIWIEHIPRPGSEPGTEESPEEEVITEVLSLCRVDFGGTLTPHTGSFTDPIWTPISREEFKGLIR